MDSFVFTGTLSPKEIADLDTHREMMFFHVFYEDGVRKLFVETLSGKRVFEEGDTVKIPEAMEGGKCGK